ncbi:MAG: hypothetical protein ACRDOB_24055 [Streptosporangiaceae bacterium]
MSLPYRQRRKLRQLDRALGAADPGLAFNLATFARINAGQTMPAHEQLRSRPGPLRRVLLWPVAGTAFLLVVVAGGGASRARQAAGLRLSRTYRPGPAPLSAGG